MDSFKQNTAYIQSNKSEPQIILKKNCPVRNEWISVSGNMILVQE